MPTSQPILDKLKHLLKLTTSPNENEADNAKIMADKLIAKYNISEEEIKSINDVKPLYTDDQRLYSVFELIEWKQVLAFVIAYYFESLIVQERLVPAKGPTEYVYYVFGDNENIKSIKSIFFQLSDKVEELIKLNCFGRGGIYIHAYSEGIISSIQTNIQSGSLELPNVYRENKEETISDKALVVKKEDLVKVKTPPPTEEKVEVSSKSLIKNISAYFKGVADGNKIELRDLLEAANKLEN